MQIFSGHEVILRAIGDSKLPKHAADCAYWGGSSCQAGEPSSVESVVAPPPTEQSLLFANAIPATRLRLSVAATALSREVGTRAEKRVSKSGQAYASFSF